MNKQELEEALEAANGKIAELTAALEVANGKNAELTAALEAAKAAPGAVAEKLTADELDIRSRQRAGLTRAQAEEAHAAQKAHDARLAAEVKAG